MMRGAVIGRKARQAKNLVDPVVRFSDGSFLEIEHGWLLLLYIPRPSSCEERIIIDRAKMEWNHQGEGRSLWD